MTLPNLWQSMKGFRTVIFNLSGFIMLNITNIAPVVANALGVHTELVATALLAICNLYLRFQTDTPVFEKEILGNEKPWKDKR